MICRTILFQSLIGLLALLSVTSCDPFVFAGVAVSLEPGLSPGPAGVSALDLATGLAREHRMEPARPPYADQTDWQCFAKGSLHFCGTQVGAEVQFYFSQAGLRFSAGARRFQEQFRERLHAAFGAEAVYPCLWDHQGSRREYVCVQIGPRGTARD